MTKTFVRRPIIGICAPVERARWAVWDMPAAVVAQMYLDAVKNAGGLAVLIPPDPHLEKNPDEILDRVDGLMVLGGADVDATRYGQERHPDSEPPQRVRDAVELALTRRAVDRGTPFLGICRGLQILNVAYGGTLTQHLPESLGHTEHRRVVGKFQGNEHRVILDRGSLAARVIGAETHQVYSHHHQAVEAVGDGLVVTGRSDDGTVEVLERDAPGGFMLGVQWHPEADVESPVITGFVQACRTHVIDGVPSS